jgi:hypothetical protein
MGWWRLIAFLILSHLVWSLMAFCATSRVAHPSDGGAAVQLRQKRGEGPAALPAAAIQFGMTGTISREAWPAPDSTDIVAGL